MTQQINATRRELETLERAPASELSEFADIVRHFRVEQLTGILRWLEANRTQLAPPKTLKRTPTRAKKRRA